jgi:hypothetical protein
MKVHPHKFLVVAVISAERIEQAQALIASFADMVETRRPGHDEHVQTASYDARLLIRESEAR